MSSLVTASDSHPWAAHHQSHLCLLLGQGLLKTSALRDSAVGVWSHSSPLLGGAQSCLVTLGMMECLQASQLPAYIHPKQTSKSL